MPSVGSPHDRSSDGRREEGLSPQAPQDGHADSVAWDSQRAHPPTTADEHERAGIETASASEIDE